MTIVKGKKFVEVGCWAGNSTQTIAKEAKKRKGILFAVDWWKGNEGTRLKELAKVDDIKAVFIKNMKAVGVFDKINVVHKKSVDAAKNFKDESIDFLFIDGDHRYKGILADLKAWHPKVKKGGIICGHDFNSYTYVERYVNIDCVNGVHHGTTKAVMNFFKGQFDVVGRIWWKQK